MTRHQFFTSLVALFVTLVTGKRKKPEEPIEFSYMWEEIDGGRIAISNPLMYKQFKITREMNKHIAMHVEYLSRMQNST